MGKHQAPQDPVSLVLPPSLYLGPRSSASKPSITGNYITHVLSIGANPLAKVDGVTYYRLSICDSSSATISKITDAACDIIDGAIASKQGTGRILVHCMAGISRSPMVVTAYLMKRKGMTLKAALAQIVGVRPQISPNAGFIQQLKEVEMQLYGSCSLEVDELPKREKDRLALFEEPKEQPNDQPKEQSNEQSNSSSRKCSQTSYRSKLRRLPHRAPDPRLPGTSVRRSLHNAPSSVSPSKNQLELRR
jgi:atypical dual specificity phosphatase